MKSCPNIKKQMRKRLSEAEAAARPHQVKLVLIHEWPPHPIWGRQNPKSKLKKCMRTKLLTLVGLDPVHQQGQGAPGLKRYARAYKRLLAA